MKRVLIIDDDCFKEEESIREGFAETGIDFFLCDNKDEGLKLIRSSALFDCIVLDWYLEEENSELSQLVLKQLERKYYAPVLIYSAHSENFRQVRDSGAITYPVNLIHEVDKGNFKDLLLKVSAWVDTNTTARLSNIYLEKVYEHIHKTFWSLNDIGDGNIAAVYKNIISENGNIDWSNDFIINLLLQSITSDKIFRDGVSLLIEQVQTDNLVTSTAEKRKILNKILYFKSTPEFLSNGDIIKIRSAEQSCYGFITTPDCDLSQNNTRYIEFIEVIKYKSIPLLNKDSSIAENGNGNHFYLPAVLDGESMIDMVAVFKANHFLTAKNNRSDKYPGVATRIKYADTFIYNNSDCSLTYICSLVNPYKSELLHKKNSHNSRVGIPGVYEYLKTN